METLVSFWGFIILAELNIIQKRPHLASIFYICSLAFLFFYFMK